MRWRLRCAMRWSGAALVWGGGCIGCCRSDAQALGRISRHPGGCLAAQGHRVCAECDGSMLSPTAKGAIGNGDCGFHLEQWGLLCSTQPAWCIGSAGHTSWQPAGPDAGDRSRNGGERCAMCRLRATPDLSRERATRNTPRMETDRDSRTKTESRVSSTPSPRVAPKCSRERAIPAERDSDRPHWKTAGVVQLATDPQGKVEAQKPCE